MYTYRITSVLMALTGDDQKRMRIILLDAGTIVRTRRSDPMLPKSGLVDIEVEGQTLSVFMQDLESRAERMNDTGT